MLSGGEQQGLGIARAFLHSSEILLLDEPTSNLDSLNESVILWSLKEHCKDKTIILVSHRHSTLSICDHI
ncbi:ABC transporter [Brevinema andersonii]|uniref:ABC transporter n=1 Tax=Brevinema andersonii TaxID=34097 RepID=A0A1I1DNN2_BREAD|nr:ABC transporter [Brevinema andersonii]